MAIHPRAVVDPAAELAEDVEVGPWSVIGPKVRIGPGCTIAPNVIINGRTTIGANNHIHPFNSIGGDPQDKKYRGEDTELIIGDGNTIREYCTLHRGTAQDQGVTRIGDDNWIMSYVHVAHDCMIGNHTIFANNASLAGHVIIRDWVILGGFAQIHQFCEIGEHAFISFSALVNQSVPPYVTVSGEKSRPRGVNSEGLKRRGFTPEQVQNVRRAYRTLYRSGLTLEEARVQLAEMAESAGELRTLVDFIGQSERAIIR
jgi:UDP-N-acetylglucosamine acyltransferase